MIVRDDFMNENSFHDVIPFPDANLYLVYTFHVEYSLFTPGRQASSICCFPCPLIFLNWENIPNVCWHAALALLGIQMVSEVGGALNNCTLELWL